MKVNLDGRPGRVNVSRLYHMTPARHKDANRKHYRGFDWSWQPGTEGARFEAGTVIGSVSAELGVSPRVIRQRLRKAGLSAPYTDKKRVLEICRR